MGERTVSYCEVVQGRMATPCCYAEGNFVTTAITIGMSAVTLAVGVGYFKTPTFLQRLAGQSEIFSRRAFVIGAQIGGGLGGLCGLVQGIKTIKETGLTHEEKVEKELKNNIAYSKLLNPDFDEGEYRRKQAEIRAIQGMCGADKPLAFEKNPVQRWAHDIVPILGCAGCLVLENIVFSLGFQAIMTRIKFIPSFWSFMSGLGSASGATAASLALLLSLWPTNMGPERPGHLPGGDEL